MNRKTILVDVPNNFLINNIIDNGNIYKSGKLEIDECLVDEIKRLWWLGIHTQGCCCGHNQAHGFIQVERTDLQRMIDFGYEWYHDYPEELGGKNRYDAFIPKSKCICNEVNNND